MSGADRLAFVAAVVFLWVLTLAVVAATLHGLEALPSDYSFSLTILLMGLGGVLYFLSLTFVNYYGGIEFRLF